MTLTRAQVHKLAEYVSNGVDMLMLAQVQGGGVELQTGSFSSVIIEEDGAVVPTSDGEKLI